MPKDNFRSTHQSEKLQKSDRYTKGQAETRLDPEWLKVLDRRDNLKKEQPSNGE